MWDTIASVHGPGSLSFVLRACGNHEVEAMCNVNRRQFLGGGCGALAAGWATAAPERVAAGETRKNATASRFALVRRFENAHLKAVSPDATKICLFFTTDAAETFRLDRGRWRWLNQRKEDRGAVVMELGSWRELRSVRLRRVPFGSFFADSRRLYLETDWYEDRAIQRLVLDCETGETVENLWATAHERVALEAFEGELLVGRNFKRRENWLFHVQLPEWREMNRRSYSPTGIVDPELYPERCGPVFAADRQVFLHPYGSDLVVYRRSKDLSVKWTWTVPYRFLVFRIGVTPDGGALALALAESAMAGSEGRVVLLDGQAGTEWAQVATNGKGGVALSPGRNYLAVGQQVQHAGATEMRVQIFALPSGQLMETLLHDRLRIKRGHGADGYYLVDGIQFTPDGKYLVSSGRHTNIWAVPK